MQFRHLCRALGGFIGSKIKRNPYPKTDQIGETHSTGKKTQAGEEARRLCSASFEEKPRRRRSILRRPFCLRSISPTTHRETPIGVGKPGLAGSAAGPGLPFFLHFLAPLVREAAFSNAEKTRRDKGFRVTGHVGWVAAPPALARDPWLTGLAIRALYINIVFSICRYRVRILESSHEC